VSGGEGKRRGMKESCDKPRESLSRKVGDLRSPLVSSRSDGGNSSERLIRDGADVTAIVTEEEEKKKEGKESVRRVRLV